MTNTREITDFADSGLEPDRVAEKASRDTQREPREKEAGEKDPQANEANLEVLDAEPEAAEVDGALETRPLVGSLSGASVSEGPVASAVASAAERSPCACVDPDGVTPAPTHQVLASLAGAADLPGESDELRLDTGKGTVCPACGFDGGEARPGVSATFLADSFAVIDPEPAKNSLRRVGAGSLPQKPTCDWWMTTSARAGLLSGSLLLGPLLLSALERPAAASKTFLRLLDSDLTSRLQQIVLSGSSADMEQARRDSSPDGLPTTAETSYSHSSEIAAPSAAEAALINAELALRNIDTSPATALWCSWPSAVPWAWHAQCPLEEGSERDLLVSMPANASPHASLVPATFEDASKDGASLDGQIFQDSDTGEMKKGENIAEICEAGVGAAVLELFESETDAGSAWPDDDEAREHRACAIGPDLKAQIRFSRLREAGLWRGRLDDETRAELRTQFLTEHPLQTLAALRTEYGVQSRREKRDAAKDQASSNVYQQLKDRLKALDKDQYVTEQYVSKVLFAEVAELRASHHIQEAQMDTLVAALERCVEPSAGRFMAAVAEAETRWEAGTLALARAQEEALLAVKQEQQHLAHLLLALVPPAPQEASCASDSAVGERIEELAGREATLEQEAKSLAEEVTALRHQVVADKAQMTFQLQMLCFQYHFQVRELRAALDALLSLLLIFGFVVVGALALSLMKQLLQARPRTTDRAVKSFQIRIPNKYI